jgi:alkylation response protein AidB-like acyl-CoA dehydrogenase
MDLMQSADQDAIQETVRSFLDKELPVERVRRLADAGDFGPLVTIWKRAAVLGFFGLGIPAAAGGSGFSLTEEMILFEELGRSVAPGPWLGTVVAVHGLSRCAGDTAGLTERVLAGDLPVACVEYDGDSLDIGGAAIRGELGGATSAAIAGAVLLFAGERVLLIHGDADRLKIESQVGLDPTRNVSVVSFRDAPYLELASGDEARRLRDEAVVLSCAEAVGGIQKTVEMSVEYAKVRTQFGVPIGSFQAVKHRCADMAVRAEVARSATIYATICVRDRVADAGMQASMAKLLCGDAYIDNAADNVQNHGGMGFTWECDAHLYVKRSRSFELLLGSRQQQLDQIVAGFRASA